VKNRSDSAALLEQIAAETSQVLQAERKIEFEIFLEAVLLGIGEHAVGQRLRISRRQKAPYPWDEACRARGHEAGLFVVMCRSLRPARSFS